MSLPAKIKVAGATSLGGCGGCGPSGNCASPFSVELTAQALVKFGRSINSPVTWIDLLASTGITLATFLSLQASGGIVQVRVSSPLAVDQVMPVSDLLVLVNKLSGSELTAIAVRGVGTIEVVIGGS